MAERTRELLAAALAGATWQATTETWGAVGGLLLGIAAFLVLRRVFAEIHAAGQDDGINHPTRWPEPKEKPEC